MTGKKAAIIGMAGKMSRHCLIPMLQRQGYNISGYDINTDAARTVQNELDVPFEEDIEKLVRQSNLTVISTSISSTPDVIKQIGPYVEPGNCIFDITSVKSIPNRINRTKVETTTLELLLKNSDDRVCVFTEHPVHGPTVMPRGQKYIFMPGRDANNWYSTIDKMLKREGVKIIESTPEEHDKAMAIVQVLSHTLRVLSADAITELSKKFEIDIMRLYDFSSPVYETEFNLTARVLSGNPEVYFWIQNNNPYTFQVLDVLDKARKTHGHQIALLRFLEFTEKWIANSALLAPVARSLDSVVGQPNEMQLIFYCKQTGMMKEILPYSQPVNYKKELLELRIDSGSFSKIMKSGVNIAKTTFWMPQGEKKEGQYVFLMKADEKTRQALGLGEDINELLFSPWNPELAKPLKNHYRIQLDNRFSDYYLNFFDTLHTTRKGTSIAEKIGPVVVVGHTGLAEVR